ncbi:MAG: PilN domain-containing protein [Candidatus Muiribacteriaceae bacterium]
MKLKLDLLPHEHKSIARDLKSWIALGVLILLTFSWYIPMNRIYNGRIEKQSRLLSEVKNNVRSVNSRIQALSQVAESPVNVPADITYLINFLSEKSYSWYGFFHSIERALPGRLWIDNIEKSSINEFYLTGEAADNYYISEFYHSLLKMENFDNVYLLSSIKEKDPETERKVYRFRIHLVLGEENI